MRSSPNALAITQVELPPLSHSRATLALVKPSRLIIRTNPKGSAIRHVSTHCLYLFCPVTILWFKFGGTLPLDEQIFFSQQNLKGISEETR